MRYPGYLGDLVRDVLDEGGEMADTLIPTVLDAVLFNAGMLQEYLDLRGDLLAPAERDLIAAWLARPPSVHEVEGCEPGQWLDLRDLRTGATSHVIEHLGSQQVRERMLLHTRVADVGDGEELYGGISVIRVHELDTLLDLLDGEPDAEDLIGYLLARLGPPALVTPEGDPLELCTATFTTTSPVKLARDLDRLFTRDNPGTWLVASDTDGGGGQADVVRALASLELTGRPLTLQAMSRARVAHVVDLLDGVHATLTQTDFEVTDPGQMRGGDGEPGDAELAPPGEPSLIEDPEIQAALAEHVARYETSWADSQIPALRGLTPRQPPQTPPGARTSKGSWPSSRAPAARNIWTPNDSANSSTCSSRDSPPSQSAGTFRVSESGRFRTIVRGPDWHARSASQPRFAGRRATAGGGTSRPRSPKRVGS